MTTDPDKKISFKSFTDAMKGVSIKEFYWPAMFMVFGFVLGASFAYTHGMFLCNDAVEVVLEEYQCFMPATAAGEELPEQIPNECYYYCDNCELENSNALQ